MSGKPAMFLFRITRSVGVLEYFSMKNIAGFIRTMAIDTTLNGFRVLFVNPDS